MMKLAAAFGVSAVTMLALDALWIGVLAKAMYQDGIGHLMAPRANVAAAVAFYLVYLSGVMFFAVVPSEAGGSLKAAALGAAFGFVAYATYDLTNMATLKDWPLGVTLADLCWGTFITATTAAAGKWALDRF